MKKEDSNPVVQIVDGVEVRRTNKVTVTFPSDEYARLIRLETRFKQYNLSIAKIISIMGQPCTQCGCDNATIMVPKGVLSTKRSFSGGTRSNKKNGNSRQDPK